MRILLAHNFYRSGSPGGEDIVFAQERELLREAGHEVVCYTRSNDEMRETSLVDSLKTAVGLRRSARTQRELSVILREFRPEVAHFHNTFPLLSESGLDACCESGVPVVQTLHNYRHVCISATHFREGRICEDCVPGDPLAGVRHRCYRNFPASAAVAWMTMRNHASRMRTNVVARYLVLNQFMANRLRNSGIAPTRIVIKPNFVNPPTVRRSDSGGYALFAGRVSTEKGCRTLIDAWRSELPWRLKIVGDGPLRSELASTVEREGLPVDLMGMKPREEVWRLLAGADVLIVPSIWFEGLPLVALEAFAMGVPVVASRLGGLGELIGDDECGLGFVAGDAADLRRVLRALHGDPDLRVRLLGGASRKVRTDFSAGNSLRILEATYRAVIADRVAA